MKADFWGWMFRVAKRRLIIVPRWRGKYFEHEEFQLGVDFELTFCPPPFDHLFRMNIQPPPAGDNGV